MIGRGKCEWKIYAVNNDWKHELCAKTHEGCEEKTHFP